MHIPKRKCSLSKRERMVVMRSSWDGASWWAGLVIEVLCRLEVSSGCLSTDAQSPILFFGKGCTALFFYTL